MKTDDSGNEQAQQATKKEAYVALAAVAGWVFMHGLEGAVPGLAV